MKITEHIYRKLENEMKSKSIFKTTTKRRRKKSGSGYNSFKYSVLCQKDKVVNTLDLGGIPISESREVIFERIKDTIKTRTFPLRIITHSIVDKVKQLYEVIEKFKKCKMVRLDETNPFTFTILRKSKNLK